MAVAVATTAAAVAVATTAGKRRITLQASREAPDWTGASLFFRWKIRTVHPVAFGREQRLEVPLRYAALMAAAPSRIFAIYNPWP